MNEGKSLTREELLSKATHYVEHRYTVVVDGMAEADAIIKDVIAAGFCTVSMGCYKSTHPKVHVSFGETRQVKDWEKEESAMLRDVVKRLADVEMSDKLADVELYSLVCDATAVLNRLKGVVGWHEGSLNG